MGKIVTTDLKTGDQVTIKLEDNYFDQKIGVFVKMLTKKEIGQLNKEGQYSSECGPIVINLPQIKEIHFNSHMNNSIPKEKKKWLFMKPEEIIIRKEGSEMGPLTIEEIIDFELAQMVTPPYVNIQYTRSRMDKKCWIQDCNEDEHGGIWFNVWGSGTRISVCKNHFDKHGKITLCDSIPFKLKTSNN